MQNNPPFLRVVRGNPTAEELAAITVVLAAKARAAAAGGQPATSTYRRSDWSAKSRLMLQSVSPSPDGWKRSAFPR